MFITCCETLEGRQFEDIGRGAAWLAWMLFSVDVDALACA